MKVTGINGKEYVWNLIPYDVKKDSNRARSKYHLRARELLSEIFHCLINIITEIHYCPKYIIV